ncbi:MAG TPA: hypothetical protein VMP01_12920 [Pirellulaceae bacterium]|nr:hypothetical protein [Pirellulaceae bacterium]
MRLTLAIIVAILSVLLGPTALGQNRTLPLFGSYYEGSTSYRAQFYTNREYLKIFMNSRADYWFVVDDQNQVKGAGLAIYDFDFALDWPLVIKNKVKDVNVFGAALDPNVAIMLKPSTSAHKFLVSGTFIPEKPAVNPGDKPQPARVDLKFKWQDEKAQLHLIVGGSPAGSGIPVAVGQEPAEGSVKQDLLIPPMYPFGSDGTKIVLHKDPGSNLYAGRDDYDGKGTADNVHIVIHSVVLETINYPAARNPANNHLVSPVGTYEGFISQQVRYHTDRQSIGMLISSTADLWLAIDEKGKVRGEVVADYSLDFGVDWTLATKTGVSMAKSMGLPIDPSVAVVLDPATARQRFILEGELQGDDGGVPTLLAPQAVRLNLRLKPNQSQQLRILVLGELSGAATPTVAGTTAAAATALGRVIKYAMKVDAPRPFATEEWVTGIVRRTPYGPYATDFFSSLPGRTPNTHVVLAGFIKQQSVRAELSPCPKEWVPNLMTSAGTTVKFEAKLVGPAKRPAKWKFTLEHSSRLPGMCNNADLPPRLLRQWQNKINQRSEDLLFDFRKYDGSREPQFKSVVGPPYNILETKEATSDPVQFEVSCLDFGAYGRLIAEADFGYGWVRAVVRQTGEPVAYLPYASNIDEAERHMAQAAKTYGGEPKFANLLPEPDADKEPRGNGIDGDGLSNFEEYRGFVVRNGNQQLHVRLDPDKKDLFVFMSKSDGQKLGGYLPDFEKASRLKVHRVGNDPLTNYVNADDRVINFNSEQRHSKPQTALHLKTGRLRFGLVGRTFPDDGFGPPVNVTAVQVDVVQCHFIEAMNQPYSPNTTRSTTIHELGHAVGMRHHGNTNIETAAGLPVAVEGGQNSGEYDCAMRYTDGLYFSHYDRAATAPSGPLTLGSILPRYETILHPYDMSLERNSLAFCTDPVGSRINRVIPDCGRRSEESHFGGQLRAGKTVAGRSVQGTRGETPRQIRFRLALNK